MAPTKKNSSAKKSRPIVNFDGVPEEAEALLRSAASGPISADLGKRLAKIMNVGQLIDFIENNDDNINLADLRKPELLAEAVRLSIRLLETVGAAAKKVKGLESDSEEEGEDENEKMRPCCICKKKPPRYVFEICHCQGVCRCCRAILLWGSKKAVPFHAKDILDNLRASCPACGERMFGRSIQRVNFV